MPVAKEQIRQIISENNITSVADVYSLLRDSFKDILQELMEAEMDSTLGYGKNQKGDIQSDNKRNGHSTKTLKSQYGEFQIEVPRDRNGEFEPKLVPKYQRDISGIEEKVIFLYAWWMSTRDLNCRYWVTLKIITSRGSIPMTIWHKALQLFHDFYYDISFLSYISSSVTKRTSLCVCA